MIPRDDLSLGKQSLRFPRNCKPEKVTPPAEMYSFPIGGSQSGGRGDESVFVYYGIRPGNRGPELLFVTRPVPFPPTGERESLGRLGHERGCRKLWHSWSDASYHTLGDNTRRVINLCERKKFWIHELLLWPSGREGTTPFPRCTNVPLPAETTEPKSRTRSGHGD